MTNCCISHIVINGLNTILSAIMHDSTVIIVNAAYTSTACVVNVTACFFGCIIEGKQL
ncbi:MAG: hypothetical protein IJ784_13585 [Ruminiclostridium sp.]|nr:hypothetical protein [Ruminiclostridium sp.]